MLKRTKPYKASSPFETINKVRSKLSECDLFTIEFHYSYPHAGVACCRIIFGDEGLRELGIGTNGKGMTTRYALASGYGEFMERLQNNVLFPIRQLKFATARYLNDNPKMHDFRKRLEEQNLVLDYHYAPDEKYLGIDMIVKQSSDILTKAFHLDSKDYDEEFYKNIMGDESFACVPFYSVFEGKVRMLPMKMLWNLCGSNGMSAGNTPEEALIQGISEIFERYVVRTIFQQHITPPDIPNEYFEGTQVLEKLQSLERKRAIKFTIKDCSLGKGLPVIGLLLENQMSGKYAFHIGSDPSLITALERCLTEIYQGGPKEVDQKFKKKLVSLESLNWLEEYFSANVNGTGQWPYSIFSDENTYEFKGFDHTESASDREDLCYLLNLMKENGVQVFIRDVSFLGFPTFFTYVPGMSELDFIFDQQDLPNWTNIEHNMHTLLNLGNASNEELLSLVDAIEKADKFAGPVAFEPNKWMLCNDNEFLRTLHPNYMMALIFAKVEDYKSARENMEKFMVTDSANKGPMLYYEALKRYFSLRGSGLSIPEVETILANEFGNVLIDKVIKDVAVPENIFGGREWPSCFDCARCRSSQTCRYFDVLKTVKRLQTVQIETMPDQERLSKYFQ